MGGSTSSPVGAAAISSPEAVEVGLQLLLLAVGGYLLYRLGRWIYRDATARGSEWAWQWATGIPMLLVLGFVPGFLVLGFVPGLLVLIIYLQLRNDQLREADASESRAS